jgi:septal ring-binding cell division protein DamX
MNQIQKKNLKFLYLETKFLQETWFILISGNYSWQPQGIAPT